MAGVLQTRAPMSSLPCSTRRPETAVNATESPLGSAAMKTASSITTRAVKPVSFSRRAVMGSLAAGALVASVPAGAHAVTTGNGRAQERRARARQVRLEAVRLEELFPLPDRPSND